MDEIMEIANRHGLIVIEDAAQAIGSMYKGKLAGSIGHFGCFSAHPLKNLNALGDGGFVTTNDKAAAERMRRLRAHGMADRQTIEEWGMVSRMDTLQAAILNYRLDKLPDVIAKRRDNAALYQKLLHHERMYVPTCRNEEFNTFHTFVMQVDRRDELQAASEEPRHQDRDPLSGADPSAAGGQEPGAQEGRFPDDRAPGRAHPDAAGEPVHEQGRRRDRGRRGDGVS